MRPCSSPKAANDMSWHGGDPWIAPSEFELIKNRATLVKCEWPWTGTCSGGVDVGKEGSAASVGGYPCPLPIDSTSAALRSTAPNFRAQ